VLTTIKTKAGAKKTSKCGSKGKKVRAEKAAGSLANFNFIRTFTIL
jgi:hypothetical protein